MHKPTTRKMSDAHEKFLQTVFGEHATIMPNSGAGWAKQMDVRGKHREETFAFAVDGKSTFRESISVTIPMWQKAVEQAHNELPALALRWYGTYQLDSLLDLIIVDANTFKEMTDKIKELEEKITYKDEAIEELTTRARNAEGLFKAIKIPHDPS